jgi:hypothetical protein
VQEKGGCMAIESPLENWIKSNKLNTNKFSALVGCSRVVLWKVKKGLAVCPFYAKKIKELTNGEIQPAMNKIGRPW